MIEPQSGQITIGNLVIEPNLRREDFITSALFLKGDFTNPQQGWYMAIAKRQRENGCEFAVSLLFQGQRLAAVHVARADVDFGSDWSEWSETAERQRKAAHDVLLHRDLVAEREFEWGRAESVFDEKGGGSLIVVQYK